MPKADQVSVFLPDHPGELLKLCSLLRANGVNILAMSIQNARDYVQELFRARERSGRRMVLAQSYQGVLKESAEVSVIRMVLDPNAEDILSEAGYTLDVEPVICLYLSHRPGTLEEVARRFADHGINIDYVYGSAMSRDERALFVCHVPDLEAGLALFDPSGNVP